jgi:hypothetical protein
MQERRRAQINAAAARWRAKNPKASTLYARKTKYAAQKRWAAKNPEKVRKYVHAWYWRNPEKRRERQREINRAKRLADPVSVRSEKRRYYRAMMERRVGRPRPSKCELCDRPFTKQPHADHDHKTGTYRGWICGGCNSVLGIVHDNPALLRKMAKWVKHFSKKEKL